MRVSFLGIAILVTACGRDGFDPIDGQLGTDAGAHDASVDAPASMPTPNIAFVTSQTYLPTTFGSDLAGADADCAAAAQAGGLPGKYVAFLSTATVAAPTRLQESRGWVRVDGKPFLDSPNDIAIGKLYYPLLINELGGTVGASYAFTGTAQNGTSALQCGGYADSSMSITTGSTDATSADWLYSTNAACNTGQRLYCFGVGKSVPLTITPATGRQAFITTEPLTPDATGLMAADTLCSSEASLSGLTGNFLALLPTTTATAISRFSLAGSNWIRLDGIPLAASPLALASWALDTSLNVTSTRTYLGQTDVGTGGVIPDAVSPGSADDCSDWTDGSGTVRVGASTYIDVIQWRTDACNVPIFCLEE